MTTHAPADYNCPICLGIQGIESDATLLKDGDAVYKDGLVTIFINSFWIEGNEGHLIVVPNQHFVAITDVPPEVGAAIFLASQKAVSALKAVYTCDGTTLRQNNEPAGDQHAFHYHLHVFPRYTDDHFNQNLADPAKKRLSSSAERKEYAEKLHAHLLHS